jgi:hypothetical protein
MSAIPLLFKEGVAAHKEKPRSILAAAGVVNNEPRSAPYLLKLLTTPSAPIRKRSFLLVAQTPLLEKEGNVAHSNTNPIFHSCYDHA